MTNPLAHVCKNLSDHPRTVDTSASATASVRIKWPASIRNVVIHALALVDSMPFATLLVTRLCARVQPVTLAIRLLSVLPNNVRKKLNYSNVIFGKFSHLKY